MDKLKKEKMSIVTKILSSSHINFLFGAGVNGRVLPQMSGCLKTVELAEKHLGRKIVNLENDLETLNKKKRDSVLKTFIKELTDKVKEIDCKCEDIKDIESLFVSINKIVLETENRNITMKQVNIYTTNYDSIIDDSLDRLGLLYNVVSSSNLSNYDKFFEMIGYDYKKRKYVPTYLISKIHGDLTDPILPSKEKYNETLQANRFEILFNMKSQLSRPNSVIFIIGYSGNDKHINGLLRDCISFGLTVYWFKYNNEDNLPEELADMVTVIKQTDNDNKVNTTRICKEVVDGVWEKQSEE